MPRPAPAVAADLRRTQRQLRLALEQIEAHRPAAEQLARRRCCALPAARTHDRRDARSR